MSFIVGAIGGLAASALGVSTAGSIAIGAGLAGAKMGADGQKDAAKTAAAGAREEIAFNRESRDLVRGDQKPYREAGYKALDALMSLTGLGGGSGGGAVADPAVNDFMPNSGLPADMPRWKQVSQSRNSGYDSINSRAQGGAMGGGSYYNINELGPESVYSGGSYSRNPNPMTIDGQTGYVQPNIRGRALGGPMQDRNTHYGNMGPVPGGPPPPQQVLPGNNDWTPPGATRNEDGLIEFGGYNPNNQGQFPQVPNQLPGNTSNSTAINPQTGYPNENPGGEPGGYQFETDPGYQFRFSEGMRALDRGAAARGGLLSGGYARKAIRYGQGFASNEFTNVYNRISNIAGLGQTANQASGNATMYGGAAMGNAASNAANATAYGQIGAGNAWANAGNQIAQFPWGNIFQKDTGPFAGNPGTPNDF